MLLVSFTDIVKLCKGELWQSDTLQNEAKGGRVELIWASIVVTVMAAPSICGVPAGSLCYQIDVSKEACHAKRRCVFVVWFLSYLLPQTSIVPLYPLHVARNVLVRLPTICWAFDAVSQRWDNRSTTLGLTALLANKDERARRVPYNRWDKEAGKLSSATWCQDTIGNNQSNMMRNMITDKKEDNWEEVNISKRNKRRN